MPQYSSAYRRLDWPFFGHTRACAGPFLRAFSATHHHALPMAASYFDSPKWQEPSRLLEPALAKVRPWLLDDGSLTQHLIDSGRSFSLERWQQRWEAPRLDEKRMLRMSLQAGAIVRSVILKLDQIPVVFARSVFPTSSLTGPLLRLRKLENQSLGALLFARTDMRRSPFQITRLSGMSSYMPEHLHQCDSAWARRSCFMVAGKPLLVSEVFLEAFPAWNSRLPLHRSRRGLVNGTIGR
ncbi:MAG: chorismate lyase [Pseudomonadota bacterium]